MILSEVRMLNEQELKEHEETVSRLSYVMPAIDDLMDAMGFAGAADLLEHIAKSARRKLKKTRQAGKLPDEQCSFECHERLLHAVQNLLQAAEDYQAFRQEALVPYHREGPHGHVSGEGENLLRKMGDAVRFGRDR